MNSIRRLAGLLCLATLCSYSSAQQIDSTGNLINNNSWSGIGAYAPDPNDCCGNPAGSAPLYDTATDTIKWSYGQATVQQGWAVNQALQGTGLQVHGYNYQYDLRNMNGAPSVGGDQGGIDTMVVNTWLKNSAGQVILGNSTVYNTQFEWTTIGNTMTLNSPMPTSDLGTAGISFASRDGGYWAGLYGPEVRNVSFSLNYSFDPCAADPLYSSTCPGYAEAYMAYLFALLGWSTTPEPQTEVAAIDYSLTPSATASVSVPEETTTGEVKVDAGGIEVSTTGELQVPDGIPEEAREKKPVDMNLISRIVREATDDSAALSVVNKSIESSMAEDANPDSSMASETLAAIARQQDASVEQSIAENQEAAQSGIMFQSELGVVESQMAGGDMGVSEGTGESQQISTTTAPTQLADQDRIEIKQTNTDRAETAVRRDVADNDAAGDVSIEDLAQEPQDFTAYVNKQLADAQFYQTESIYRDQEPVDNRRSLRLLSGANDRLHQEMVNDQYRRR